jgi:hypothetical protein
MPHIFHSYFLASLDTVISAYICIYIYMLHCIIRSEISAIDGMDFVCCIIILHIESKERNQSSYSLWPFCF